MDSDANTTTLTNVDNRIRPSKLKVLILHHHVTEKYIQYNNTNISYYYTTTAMMMLLVLALQLTVVRSHLAVVGIIPTMTTYE